MELIWFIFGIIAGAILALLVIIWKGLQAGEKLYEKVGKVPLIGGILQKKFDKKIEDFLDSLVEDEDKEAKKIVKRKFTRLRYGKRANKKIKKK